MIFKSSVIALLLANLVFGLWSHAGLKGRVGAAVFEAEQAALIAQGYGDAIVTHMGIAEDVVPTWNGYTKESWDKALRSP